MRFNRNTWILLVGMLIIIGLLAIVANQPPASSGTTSTPEANSFRVFSESTIKDITGFTIRDNVSGQEVVLTQASDGAWQSVLSPDGLAQAPVDSMLTGLIDLQSTDQFSVTDLTPYGLGTPAYSLTLTFEDIERRVHLGSKNPSGTRYYAQLDDDRQTVYLLSTPTTLDTAVSYLSALPVLQQPTPTATPSFETAGLLFAGFSPENITAVTVRNQEGENVRFVRDDAFNWTIDPFSTQAQSRPADSLRIDTVVRAMSIFSAVDVLQGAEASALGLVPPAYEITAESADGAVYVLKIGELDPSQTRYYIQLYDLPNVGVMRRDDVDVLLAFIETPPYLIEATEEAPPAN